MSMIQGLNGLRSAVLTLGVLAIATAGADAAAILKYQTATAIGLDKGITGPNLISFTPATDAGVDLSNGEVNAGLGTFVVAPPATGSTTTYKNVPFEITFLPKELNGESLSNLSLVIKGVLNGVVDSPYGSTVTATFDRDVPSLELDNGQTLSFSFPEDTSKLLVPSQSNGGLTTIQARIDSTQIPPVPEPSTIALFVTTLGGLALRRRLAARRAEAKAKA